MKNNKGFIATSILYSFFLVFLSLFLGIIVEYLQNKNNLNYTEASIKRGLNKTIGIGDLKVGDKILLSNSTITKSNLELNKVYEIKEVPATIDNNPNCVKVRLNNSDNTNRYFCFNIDSNYVRLSVTINNQGVIEFI